MSLNNQRKAIEDDPILLANFQLQVKDYIETAFLGEYRKAFQVYPWMNKYV